MQKFQVVGASALALSVALGTGTALAVPASPRAVTVPTVADYNAAQVATANATLTVPDGLATYRVNSGTLEINSRFTVTLPPNFTFASQPSLSDTGTATFTLSGGGAGSQSVTFTVGTAPVLPGQSVTLSTFAIQGATALETPIPVAAALPISMQSTNNSQIDNNDKSPLSKGAFASEPGVVELFIGASAGGPSFPTVSIDLTSPSLGTLFQIFGKPDTATVPIAAIQVEAQQLDAATESTAVLGPDGFANALSAADTATVTVAGLFNGIKAAFAAKDSNCTTPIATGTVTATQVSIPGLPTGLNAFAVICVTADGTTLLQQNVLNFTSNVAPGSSTDFLGTKALIEFPGVITYTGGGVISVTNFFTGDDSGYSSLLRVNNSGTGPVSIFALVQPDSGGAPLSGPLGSLATGTGTVFTEQQVAAAVPGLNLANSGQRATVQLVFNGNSGDIAASSMLVNPSGVVTNVGLTPPFVPFFP